MQFVKIGLIIIAGIALTSIIGLAAIGLMLYIFALSLVLPAVNFIISTLVLAAIFYFIARRIHRYLTQGKNS